ncbi:MAG: AAA family ATPase [Methanospirillaceae archaeon]|nr:AAA family ATPase [Methanospirillaceae archaeon]
MNTLIDLLDGTGSYPVLMAVVALSGYSDERITQPLVELYHKTTLSGSDPCSLLLKLSILYTLGNNTCNNAVPSLISFIKESMRNKEYHLLFAATWALAKIGDPGALPHLVSLRNQINPFFINDIPLPSDQIDSKALENIHELVAIIRSEFGDREKSFRLWDNSFLEKNRNFFPPPRPHTTPQLQEIVVIGLFHTYTHVIPLNITDRISILYGLNGSGKTTILNMIRSFFSGDVFSLIKIPFHIFRIRFTDGFMINVYRHFFFLASESLSDPDYDIFIQNSDMYTKKGVYIEFRNENGNRISIYQFRNNNIEKLTIPDKKITKETDLADIKKTIQNDLNSGDFLIKLRKKEAFTREPDRPLHDPLRNDNTRKKIQKITKEKEFAEQKLQQLHTAFETGKKELILLLDAAGVENEDQSEPKNPEEMSAGLLDYERQMREKLQVTESEIHKINLEIQNQKERKKELIHELNVIKNAEPERIKQLQEFKESDINLITEEISLFSQQIAVLESGVQAKSRLSENLHTICNRDISRIKEKIQSITEIYAGILLLKQSIAHYEDVIDLVLHSQDKPDSYIRIKTQMSYFLDQVHHRLNVIYIDSNTFLSDTVQEGSVTPQKILEKISLEVKPDSGEENRSLKGIFLSEMLNRYITTMGVTTLEDNELKIFETRWGTRIFPDQLSSGELHLLIIFYSLICKAKPGSLIILDEPEISLHVEWKNRLLNDIAEVIRFIPMDIIVSTHSPSIIKERRAYTFTS